MTCISSAAPSTSSVATGSTAPWRAKPSVPPTSTGLIATHRLRGRMAMAQARSDPGRREGAVVTGSVFMRRPAYDSGRASASRKPLLAASRPTSMPFQLRSVGSLSDAHAAPPRRRPA